MGGTFDHMHLGHKLLLTQACLLTKDVLHIGVTGDALLVKKAYAEYLEPFAVRRKAVIDFISALTSHAKVEIFELNDPVGIAATNPNLTACILTREVEKGGKMINEARLNNNLAPVELVFVDMILCEHTAEQQKNFSNKTSSTNIRKYICD